MMRPYRSVTHCKRGHLIAGRNFKPKPNGKACRACECALSQKGNVLRSHGTVWYDRDVRAYADRKYREFTSCNVRAERVN
jgi:hypothetical protein